MTLRAVLGFPYLTLLVFIATIALTATLYYKVPKGYFPQDDFGLIVGFTRASPDVSFSGMLGLQQSVADIVLARPRRSGARLGARRRRLRWRSEPRPNVHQPEAAAATGRGRPRRK